MKTKTKKSAAKRFKLTKNGIILRRRQMANHLKSHKSKSQIRKYRRSANVSESDRKKIRRLLPYG